MVDVAFVNVMSGWSQFKLVKSSWPCVQIWKMSQCTVCIEGVIGAVSQITVLQSEPYKGSQKQGFPWYLLKCWPLNVK